MSDLATHRAAIERLRRWKERPDIFVRECLGVVPDAWQDEVLKAFPTQAQIAMCASKGPGKTAVESWLNWNFMLTRPHPKLAATSISEQNLSDGLWSEMAKWQAKSPLLKSQFVWTKTRIFSKDHPETWWMSARTWSKSADAQRQADTLAGLHAEYIMFTLDESGGIPDAVMVAAQAALSTCKEGHILQGGNTLMRSGPLYRAATADRRNWYVVEVNGDPDNPNRSPRVSIEWARQQIETYGRDNPWVMVNVFGQFPPSSINVLISLEEMMEATRRSYNEHDIRGAPKILGVDVARFGDDASVCYQRQGLVARTPRVWRGIDGPTGAGAVARIWNDTDADACFVDDTGGFGSSWIDSLRQLGKAPIGIHFSSEPHDRRYYNKRTEMYFDAVQWIRSGGQIPNRPELIAAMTSTTYTFKGDRLLLQPKDQVKEVLGYSPDEADSFILTFAEPVAAKVQSRARKTDYDWNPYPPEMVVQNHRGQVEFEPYRE